MSTEVVDRLYAEQYTGSNGAALVALVSGSLQVDDGTTLTFVGPDTFTYVMTTGQWVLWIKNPTTFIMASAVPNADFGLRYTNLTAKILSVAPTGVGATLVQSSGGPVSVPASVLGQTANYDVTMSPALPSVAYKPIAHLRGAPTIVSGHSILNVTVVSTTVVRVQVQSGAASLAGASVHANAWGLA